MRLTRAGWGLTAAGANSVLIGYLFGITELFLLCAMCLTALVAALVYVSVVSPSLKAKRSTRPAKLRAGNKAQLLLELTNRRKRRTPILFATDTIAGEHSSKLTFGSIGPHSQIKVGYSIPTTKRGILSVGPLTTTIQDPLGLAKRKLKLESNSKFLVRPQLKELPAISASMGRLKRSRKRTRSSNHGDDDFYALRPYVIGDDLRKVHWRASARSEDLLVRQDKDIKLGAVTVVLDTQAASYTADGFERAVIAANSCAHAAFSGGDLVQFYTTDVTTPVVIDSTESLNSVEEQLGLIAPDPDSDVERILEPLSRKSVGGTLIVVAGNISPELARQVSHCRYRHRQVIVISCEANRSSGLAVIYDDSQPLESVWAKAMAVTAK